MPFKRKITQSNLLQITDKLQISKITHFYFVQNMLIFSKSNRVDGTILVHALVNQ